MRLTFAGLPNFSNLLYAISIAPPFDTVTLPVAPLPTRTPVVPASHVEPAPSMVSVPVPLVVLGVTPTMLLVGARPMVLRKPVVSVPPPVMETDEPPMTSTRPPCAFWPAPIVTFPD